MRSKARLTITLPPNLLAQVDGRIDGETVRNRSHAIELLLRHSLRPEVTTAVILAGGESRGSQVPALAAIDGQALISLTIQHLLDFDFRSFVILAGEHEPQIRALMGDGRSLGVTIHYLREQHPLGTGGALTLAKRYLNNDSFLVLHGDVLTDIDIADFVDFHLRESSLATIAVKPRSTETRQGKVLLQGNKITSFLDNNQDRGIGIVNAGVYLFKPAVLSLIENRRPSRLETDVFPKLAQMGELTAFLFQGIWFDVSTPENYRLAQLRWKERRL